MPNATGPGAGDLLRRVARRAGPARIALVRLPASQWHLTLYHPRDGANDIFLTYPGDSHEEVLSAALADEAADLRGLR